MVLLIMGFLPGTHGVTAIDAGADDVVDAAFQLVRMPELKLIQRIEKYFMIDFFRIFSLSSNAGVALFIASLIISSVANA